MKRFVSLLLCAVLVLGMLPALPAVAEETSLPEGTVIYRNPEADSCAIPMAPELPIEPIRDPREVFSPMDISQSGSGYYFTTFGDLKELAAASYDDYAHAYYTGEGALVISENLTLPEHLMLTCDSLEIPVGTTLSVSEFVSTEETTVNGTLVLNECVLSARKILTVNGTIRVPSFFGGVSILSSTAFSGRENIIGEHHEIRLLYSGLDSLEKVESVLTEIEERADPFYFYQIDFSTDTPSELLTISKSLVFPHNTLFTVQSNGLIISSGCTLTINGGAFFDDITVNGILQNNNYVRFYGSASFRSDASYSGTGYLYVHPETAGMSYENIITGLDFSQFEISYLSDEGAYSLRSLPQLDTPTDLQWGFDVDLGGERYALAGCLCWKNVSPINSDRIGYSVHIYRRGENEPCLSENFTTFSENEWIGLNSLLQTQLESGTYYFTVQARGFGDARDSEIAVSPEWTYVNPGRQIAQPTDLHWDWPYSDWTEPKEKSNIKEFILNYYYKENPESEPVWVGGWLCPSAKESAYQERKENCHILDIHINYRGAGYYYFTVTLISSDITVISSSDESALSPGYYYDPADHTYVAQTPVAPTCTEQGYTTYKCAICGDSYDGDFTPATGHNWTNATCTAPKTCSVCGQTEGSALGHSWKDATCTAPKTCSVCGQTEGSALGHSYSGGSCTRCGAADPGYVPPAVEGSVTRLAGAGRVETSLAIADALKAQLGVTKFRNVLVASALNFPDALAGSYLAAKVDAPILLTYAGAQAQVMAYIHGNLQPGGTVYILGGESAVSADFVNMLSASGVNCVRVAGTDRFATNLAILEKAGVSAGQPILVCTATGFADSLSVSATGLPILLVGKSLSPAQKDFLNRCGGGKLWIIGGTGAVSPSIEEELRQYSSQIQRLAGAGRHETSVLVAETFFQEANSAVIAYSMNFPDGLCGGPLAYALSAPLILTTSTDTCVNVFTDPRNIVSGFVLGGNTLVNDSAVRRIFHQSQ